MAEDPSQRFVWLPMLSYVLLVEASWPSVSQSTAYSIPLTYSLLLAIFNRGQQTSAYNDQRGRLSLEEQTLRGDKEKHGFQGA
ncbi:hypothetical protein BX616_000158 [Lobosporangium transversale]|uniref:Uncharacterized protein n=1 Tax=Lobosporangium transversale TaxID=64571 RepID=A0A1Y2GKS1_9FUNG|nr:hypothetical protein BCR41DRAFT_397025 [Lobosporangium transversale]KAF9908432.1 hypothetical protein BX616_000158 [Lobosporangium transversale]ORZ13863.1 hypothetical protein BCR41DRAFT_397025 [Lobosporangium transversale]|eukprot:XP_021880647.1 hypothetical protein BCR41DRAFT_397025 [Lobosporangium transversale]